MEARIAICYNMANINSGKHQPKMSKFHNPGRPNLSGGGGGGVKTALITAVVAIAIGAALLGGVRHSLVYADSPSGAHVSQSPSDASQALRRYARQLLRILSDADANQWERYRQAMPHCAAAPSRLDAIGAGNDVSALDAALATLTADLCADMDRRLDEARTVGLLVNEPEAMSGYVLMTGVRNNDVHLIDHFGRIAHEWQLEDGVPHAKLLDNGNLLVMMRQDNNKRSIAEADPDGNIVWKYAPSEKLHHDFLKMPNDNILMLLVGKKTREDAIAAGVNPDLVPAEGMEYDYLIEIRPIGSEGGEIVWEWSAWDYIVQNFDATKENYGDPSEHPELIDINSFTGVRHIFRDTWDWLHVNGIDYNPALDQIMLSPRHYQELWIIDHSATIEDTAAPSSANAGNENTPPPVQMCYITNSTITQAKAARCCTDGAIHAPMGTGRLPTNVCFCSIIPSG